jgi:hypothetical protein
LGDVARSRSFRRSVSNQCGRVGIDNGTVKDFQTLEKLSSQSIVCRLQASQLARTETPQECSQRIAVREVGKTQNGWDQSVVKQRLGVLDAANSNDDSEQMGQKQIRRMIGPMRVVRPTHIGLQESAQSERFAKRVKKAQATIASQTRLFEAESEFPKTSGHFGVSAQTYLKSRFVQKPYYGVRRPFS